MAACSTGAAPTVALVLRPEWAQKVLDGSKTLELRGSATKKRCKVAVAVSGTGCLAGEVRITDCILIAERNNETGLYEDCAPYSLRALAHQHHVDNPEEVLKYQKVFGWVLEEARPYEFPESYRHAAGAIGWVRLDGPAPTKRPPAGVKRSQKRQ